MKTSPQAVAALRQMVAESAAQQFRPLRPGERVPRTASEAKVLRVVALLHDVVAADTAIKRASYARINSRVMVAHRDRAKRRAWEALQTLSPGELRALSRAVGKVAVVHLLSAAGVGVRWFYAQLRA